MSTPKPGRLAPLIAAATQAHDRARPTRTVLGEQVAVGDAIPFLGTAHRIEAIEERGTHRAAFAADGWVIRLFDEHPYEVAA